MKCNFKTLTTAIIMLALAACGGNNNPDVAKVKPEKVEITGDLSEYLQIVDGEYEVADQSSHYSGASLSIKLKALKAISAEDLANKQFELSASLLNESGMPISGTGDLICYINNDDKLMALLKKGTGEEVRKLLSVVTEENSKKIYESGNRRHSLNRYKPFIKDSFELAAYTGMRLEEVAILKYSDVVEDATGKLLYLKGTDLKFQRAHNWDNTKPNKIVYIPITPELEDLLNRLNYKQNKGVDRHLIDGDCTMSRKSLVKQMSHSFSFFRKKAGLPDNFSIKHLRKTFLTKLETQTNMSSAAGYQKTPNVILKHYIDKKVVVKEIEQRGFSYFKSNN